MRYTWNSCSIVRSETIKDNIIVPEHLILPFLLMLLLLCNNFVFLNLLFNPLNHHRYNTLIPNLLFFLFQ